MIRINLAAAERPEKARKKAAAGGGGGGAPSTPGAFQAYLLLTLFAGGAAFLCAAAWWFKDAQLKDLDRRIAADEKRQRDLQAIKVQVDAFQAKKTLLENKVNLIERLRAEQKSPVHMLDEISKALPDFVWLTGMDETAGKVAFKGQSNGLPAVADFISALQRSGWFPTVDLMASTETTGIVNFDLSSQFKNPEIAAKQAAQAAAQAAQRRPRRPPRALGSREEGDGRQQPHQALADRPAGGLGLPRRPHLRPLLLLLVLGRARAGRSRRRRGWRRSRRRSGPSRSRRPSSRSSSAKCSCWKRSSRP